jgi:hypothetical protein
MRSFSFVQNTLGIGSPLLGYDDHTAAARPGLDFHIGSYVV